MRGKLRRTDRLFLGAALALALLHALHFNHICDDAYISFRYADNLVRGHGLVFNAGEHVMGYSNLLWVLLLAALQSVGIPATLSAKLMGTGLAWATLVRVYTYLRETYSDRLPAVAATALLVSTGVFAMWIFGGLEGHLLAFLLLGAVVSALRIEPGAAIGSYLVTGLWLGLAALTRPEGVFYALPVALWLLLRDRGRRGRVGAAAALLTAALFYAAFTGWALYYYGDPLPNAYYAKMHAPSVELLARGFSIAWWFLRGHLGVHLFIVLFWAAATRLDPRAPGWLPLLILAEFVVFFLRIGGDALVYYRMWLWTLPLFALLCGEALARLLASGWSWRRQAAAGLTAAMLVATLQHSFLGREIGRLRRDDRFVRDALALGEALNARDPGTLVAANNVGALAYAARLRFVDMLGLNDPHIARAPDKRVGIPAHESHDGAYVLDRRPDLVFYGMPRVHAEPVELARVLDAGYPSDLDLLRDPRFQRNYAFVQLRLPDGRYAPVFERRTTR